MLIGASLVRLHGQPAFQSWKPNPKGPILEVEMADTTSIENRVSRMEGKHESLDVYLPKFLDSAERALARIEENQRFTRFERIAIILALAAIPVAIYFN